LPRPRHPAYDDVRVAYLQLYFIAKLSLVEEHFGDAHAYRSAARLGILKDLSCRL